MVNVADKLQIKPDDSVAIMHQPVGVDLELPDSSSAVKDPDDADAVIMFVTNRQELDERARPFVEAASRDALSDGSVTRRE